MNVRLYLTSGMPARPQFRIIWQMFSMARSRAGSFAKRISGSSALVISLELIGSGTASSVTPNDSTCRRSRMSASTDHSSMFAERWPLQMWFTPNAARARSVGSE